jgi:hypothetical protein
MVVPALLAAVAAPLVLGEARAAEAGPPDVLGAGLVTGGAMLVLYGLTRAEHGSPALVAAPLAAGLAVIAAFAVWERRAPAPLLPPGVLTTPSLRAATLGVGANALAFTAILYLGTLYLQDSLGYRPLTASLALAPIDAVALVVTLAVARRVARPEVLPATFAVSALALLWLARAPEPADYVVDVLAPLVVLGFSVPVAFVALTNQAVAGRAGRARDRLGPLRDLPAPAGRRRGGGAVRDDPRRGELRRRLRRRRRADAPRDRCYSDAGTVSSPNVSPTKSRLTWQAKPKLSAPAGRS